MNRAEREARASKTPLTRYVEATYLGYKCRPQGGLRQRRHRWGANNCCVRCGAQRNPEASPRVHSTHIPKHLAKLPI